MMPSAASPAKTIVSKFELLPLGLAFFAAKLSIFAWKGEGTTPGLEAEPIPVIELAAGVVPAGDAVAPVAAPDIILLAAAGAKGLNPVLVAGASLAACAIKSLFPPTGGMVGLVSLTGAKDAPPSVPLGATAAARLVDPTAGPEVALPIDPGTGDAGTNGVSGASIVIAELAVEPVAAPSPSGLVAPSVLSFAMSKVPPAEKLLAPPTPPAGAGPKVSEVPVLGFVFELLSTGFIGATLSFYASCYFMYFALNYTAYVCKKQVLFRFFY